MMEAATQVFSAMTLLSLIRPIVNDYQSAILREQQWSVSPKWSQGPCSITGLVLEPARSHLLRDGVVRPNPRKFQSPQFSQRPSIF